MSSIDKAAFQDSRNALLSARIQDRLQREREKNNWLDGVLREVENENGYSSPVPLVNQSTFLAMLYSTALWLRETYFTEKQAIEVLRRHVRPFVGNQDIAVSYGSKATPFSEKNAEQFARRLRNALGHASITINNDSFVFEDVNPRIADDWVTIKMPWTKVGEYTIALIAAGNDLLYAQQCAAPDADKRCR